MATTIPPHQTLSGETGAPHGLMAPAAASGDPSASWPSRSRRLPGFQDLVLVPQPLCLPTHPQEVNTAVRLGRAPSRSLELAVPIVVAVENCGRLSPPARLALAEAARLAGTAFHTAEKFPGEPQAGARRIRQALPASLSRPEPDRLQAEALELMFLQTGRCGAAEDGDRSSPDNADRWPAIPGEAELAGLIRKLQQSADWHAPIIFSLGMGRITEDISFAVRSGADIIRLHGVAAGPGGDAGQASVPLGLPTLCGLAAARRALVANGWQDRVDLVVSGGIRDGADAVKALALGAKAVAVGRGALLALGCIGCGNCDTGRCRQGIATQDPKLAKTLDYAVGVQKVYAYLQALKRDIQLLCSVMGKSDVAELAVSDLQALSVEISALTGLPLVGTGKVF